MLVSVAVRVPRSRRPKVRQRYASLEGAVGRSEKAYLKAFTAQLTRQSPDVAFSSRALAGPVADTLLAYVHDSRGSLVVMTSRGQGGLRRLWLGSVADAVIRGSSVPVLLVRPEEHPSPQPVLENLNRILVPLDGSALAETILEPATELASLAGAELILVQVIQPVGSPLEPRSTAPQTFDVELTNGRREEATGYLTSLAERCRNTGVKATYAAPLGGNVADTILGLAEAPTIGLLAMATHGRGGLKRLILGSVADKLVRTAPCPLLVYRPPAPATRRRLGVK